MRLTSPAPALGRKKRISMCCSLLPPVTKVAQPIFSELKLKKCHDGDEVMYCIPLDFPQHLQFSSSSRARRVEGRSRKSVGR